MYSSRINFLMIATSRTDSPPVNDQETGQNTRAMERNLPVAGTDTPVFRLVVALPTTHLQCSQVANDLELYPPTVSQRYNPHLLHVGELPFKCDAKRPI